MNRESLYKALGEAGNPEFSTVMRIVRALGLTLSARPRGGWTNVQATSDRRRRATFAPSQLIDEQDPPQSNRMRNRRSFASPGVRPAV